MTDHAQPFWPLIVVERTSQKGILIGRQGQMLRRIGQGARLQMQKLFNGPVHLELFVKVMPNWRRHRDQDWRNWAIRRNRKRPCPERALLAGKMGIRHEWCSVSSFPPGDILSFLECCAGEWLALRSQLTISGKPPGG